MRDETAARLDYLLSLIEKREGKCGGAACVRGTRLTVRSIHGAVMARHDVRELWPFLTDDQVNAAMHYASVHPEEVEEEPEPVEEGCPNCAALREGVESGLLTVGLLVAKGASSEGHAQAVCDWLKKAQQLLAAGGGRPCVFCDKHGPPDSDGYHRNREEPECRPVYCNAAGGGNGAGSAEGTPLARVRGNSAPEGDGLPAPTGTIPSFDAMYAGPFPCGHTASGIVCATCVSLREATEAPGAREARDGGACRACGQALPHDPQAYRAKRPK